MLDTTGALGLADDPVDARRLMAAAGPEADFRLPGLVAAVMWAVGLVIGVVSFLTGHAWVAAVALGAAVLAPWFGLAWVSHTQRGAYNIALPAHD
ncbi:hypothetical protein [Mycobacterium sp. Marseille-P9652]|uniref:hypothetical protein n=1 Tax=Mycobacterium sp. Marseille-P9652 TaxID=2654950 RepID=UPI0012E76862|nr:hypothetical protein [Mycobacterium sp. Marseille-P9652]